MKVSVIQVWIMLAISYHLSTVTCGMALKLGKDCPHGYYDVQPPLEQRHCQKCLACPKGHEPSVKCDSSIHPKRVDAECVECRIGYTKEYKGYTSCKPCSTCFLHQEETQSCKPDQDRHCGKGCKEGYYLSSDSTQCLECCVCGYGTVTEKACKGSKGCRPQEGEKCPFHTTTGPEQTKTSKEMVAPTETVAPRQAVTSKGSVVPKQTLVPTERNISAESVTPTIIHTWAKYSSQKKSPQTTPSSKGPKVTGTKTMLPTPTVRTVTKKEHRPFVHPTKMVDNLRGSSNHHVLLVVMLTLLSLIVVSIIIAVCLWKCPRNRAYSPAPRGSPEGDRWRYSYKDVVKPDYQMKCRVNGCGQYFRDERYFDVCAVAQNEAQRILSEEGTVRCQELVREICESNDGVRRIKDGSDVMNWLDGKLPEMPEKAFLYFARRLKFNKILVAHHDYYHVTSNNNSAHNPALDVET